MYVLAKPVVIAAGKVIGTAILATAAAQAAEAGIKAIIRKVRRPKPIVYPIQHMYR